MKRETTYVPLFALPIAAAGCAGVIVYCGLVYRNRDTFESALYGSIALLAMYSILVLSASAARRTRWMVVVSVVAATVGLAASLSLILIDFQESNAPGGSNHPLFYRRPERLLWPLLGFGWLIGATACLIGLVKGTRLNARYKTIRSLTMATLAALSLVIALCLPGPAPILIGEPLATQAMILLGSVSGFGLFTTLVLARATQIEKRRGMLLEFSEIALECPRCQTAQTVTVGESSCKHCKLQFQIGLQENRCDTCGYSLYRLESSTCPECGNWIMSNAKV